MTIDISKVRRLAAQAGAADTIMGTVFTPEQLLAFAKAIESDVCKGVWNELAEKLKQQNMQPNNSYQQEPDLFTCPNCGGEADNGFSRSVPPSPYWCTKCMRKQE